MEQRKCVVSMMEWAPCCMMDGLDGECESCLWRVIGAMVYGKRRNGVEGKL
jgi:hypothetical protein